MISDEGDVWRCDGAWIMCLWALRDYREWSQRFANPLLRPFARQVCEIVSENRHAISRWFANDPAERLQERLAAIPRELCTDGGCRKRADLRVS